MRSLTPIIASNGLAIILTVVCLLPITSILGFIATAPLDNAAGEVGLWLHDLFKWTLPKFDTKERFAKIGFAIRVIILSVGISFLYFWITNWLNMGFAQFREKDSLGRQSTIVEAIQPWIFVGPSLVLLSLFLLFPAFSTLNLSLREADGGFSSQNYAFLWDPTALGYIQIRLALRNSVLWLIFVPSV